MKAPRRRTRLRIAKLEVEGIMTPEALGAALRGVMAILKAPLPKSTRRRSNPKIRRTK